MGLVSVGVLYMSSVGGLVEHGGANGGGMWNG